MRAKECPGFSVLELLLALLLLAVVVHGSWSILVRHREAGSTVALRAEGLETVRTLAWLLSEEVSLGRAQEDWWALGEDSLSLRSFRGSALVDGGSGPERTVCYRGLRNPAPEKDSVLLLGTDGRWQALDLVSRAGLSTGCPGWDGAQEERWSLSRDPGEVILARVFERGSYHMVDGALRYRRGLGGRQPLTPERIAEGRLMGPGEGGTPFGWEIILLGSGEVSDTSGSGRTLRWRGVGW